MIDRNEGKTYLGRKDGERNSEPFDVLHVKHSRVDDGHAREELGMRTGEHGDLSAPYCPMKRENRTVRSGCGLR